MEMMDTYHIKKIGERGKLTVWIVDGNAVRRDLDEEFTNFGEHFRFSCIPEYELWIDQEKTSDEQKFFISHLLAEWKRMKKGDTYADAITYADRIEMAERTRAGDRQLVFSESGAVNLEHVHKKIIQTLPSGVNIWIVSGRLVRSAFYIDFTEGGHEFVYPTFVPKNEVWIDDDVEPEERPYVLLHELFERSRMAEGVPYDTGNANDAHPAASALEWKARHDGTLLKDELLRFGCTLPLTHEE
jgi:hypothetical protein